MIPKEITQELQSGMGLEECLIKHNTNLKKLFEMESNPFEEVMQYIEKRGKNYYIKKKILSKTYFFGIYSTLEDAQRVRDKLILSGWKQCKVDSICKELGVERIPGQNEHRYYEKNNGDQL